MLKRNGYVLEQLLSPLVVLYNSRIRRVKVTRARLYHTTSRPSLSWVRRNEWRLFEKESHRV